MGLRCPVVETDSRALATHASDVVAAASGRTLVLYAAVDAWGPLPPTVTEVRCGLPAAEPGVVFDSIVSVGQLGSALDLRSMLGDLLAHAGDHTRLLFCEPTITSDDPTSRPPHDVTTSLWAAGWTVIDCRRFRAGRGRRAQEYVWGRARPRPAFAREARSATV